MSTRRRSATVRQSVIERLVDAEPRVSEEAPDSWEASVARKRRSVQQDLEWLLNTRRIHELAPPHLEELQRSVYHYGLPDLTSRSADSPDARHELLREVEHCIRLFEPRLSDVRVLADGGETGPGQRVRFRIEARLRMEPDPEKVSFDTLLEVSSGVFSVEGEDDA